jgi:DNA-binding transcriptional LysR family regulator
VTTPLQLRHAASLAQHGSFRRAAATLRISQPALTKSIQTLESKLGVKLFERRRDGVIPTEFGKLALKHAQDMLLGESEFLRQINLLAGLETGSVSVALGPLPNAMSSYPAAGSLLSKHPNLRITLQSIAWREVTQAVVDKKVDLGIAELSGAVLDDSLQTELVGQHRAHFCCRAGHPILRERAITMKQLLNYPWATTRLPPRQAAALPRDTVRAGSVDSLSGDFIPAVDVGAPSNLGRLVERTDVLVLCTLSLVEPDLRSGGVVIVPTTGLDLRASYGFIYLKSRPVSPATQAFMAEIRAHERSLAVHERELEAKFGRAGKQAHVQLQPGRSRLKS